jgi:hypothetical protein
MVNVPSSTLLPLGSVTEISLPISARGACVVKVTALGATFKIAPLMGTVLVKEFAKAVDEESVNHITNSDVIALRNLRISSDLIF